MTDRQLEELGVKAMGDRLRIRAFCERKSQTAAEQKKRQDAVEKLKSMLSHQRASKRSHGRDTVKRKEKKITKTAIKFEFGWKHWCQQAKTFKQKKKGSGGGTRVLDVPKLACADDCLEMAKELFFPLGISPEGSLDEMDLTLGDFSGCCVGNVNVDGELLPFTAERYKTATGFTKPRLYLLSKEKLPYDSGDEEDLLRPILPPCDASEAANAGQSQLIGTSKEREEYRDQLAWDLAASLQQDRAKEEKRRRRGETFCNQQRDYQGRRRRSSVGKVVTIPFRVSFTRGARRRKFCSCQSQTYQPWYSNQTLPSRCSDVECVRLDRVLKLHS